MTAPTVAVDTSALYAVLDGDDDRHADAARIFGDLLDRLAAEQVAAVTHSAAAASSFSSGSWSRLRPISGPKR